MVNISWNQRIHFAPSLAIINSSTILFALPRTTRIYILVVRGSTCSIQLSMYSLCIHRTLDVIVSSLVTVMH